MNWNPFKRIAELERWARDLNDFYFGSSRRIKHLEDEMGRIASLEKRLQEMDRRLNPYAAAPVRSEGEPVFTKAEVADAA